MGPKDDSRSAFCAPRVLKGLAQQELDLCVDATKFVSRPFLNGQMDLGIKPYGVRLAGHDLLDRVGVYGGSRMSPARQRDK